MGRSKQQPDDPIVATAAVSNLWGLPFVRNIKEASKPVWLTNKGLRCFWKNSSNPLLADFSCLHHTWLREKGTLILPTKGIDTNRPGHLQGCVALQLASELLAISHYSPITVITDEKGGQKQLASPLTQQPLPLLTAHL